MASVHLVSPFAEFWGKLKQERQNVQRGEALVVLGRRLLPLRGSNRLFLLDLEEERLDGTELVASRATCTAAAKSFPSPRVRKETEESHMSLIMTTKGQIRGQVHAWSI